MGLCALPFTLRRGVPRVCGDPYGSSRLISLTLLGDFSKPTRFVWWDCGRPFGKAFLPGLCDSETAAKREVGSAVRMLLRGWEACDDCCEEGNVCLRLAEFPGLLMNTSVSSASCSRMFWCGEKRIGSTLVDLSVCWPGVLARGLG